MRADEKMDDALSGEEKRCGARTLRALEKGFADIETEADAARAIDELEGIAVSIDEPPQEPNLEAPVSQILQRKQIARSGENAVDVIAETTAQVAKASPENEVMLDAAIPAADEESKLCEPSQRGRTLLRQEMLKRLAPFDSLDAIVYLEINRLPHPEAADRWLGRFSRAMTGGHGWIAVLVVAALVDRRRAWRVALHVLPALWLSTMTVEYPVKRFFRRQRPFLAIVEAIVVGRKPGSFSFPSGHSAAAFAGASLLARQYPQAGRVFYCVAGLVAFSRVYLGAHYPGDVLTGGLLGAGLARLFRSLIFRAFRGIAALRLRF